MGHRTNFKRMATTTPVAAALLLAAMGGTAQAADRNRDGIPDWWEKRHGLSLKVNQARRDQDRDGLNNLYEFRSRTSPRDKDSDNDRIGDRSEDPDRDRLTNRQEQLSLTAPRDADSDNDGVTDDSEDADCDGLENNQEFVVRTLPLDRDRDNDGISDGNEDRDRDGLKNATEFAFGHNPNDADSDDDGVVDSRELAGTVVSFDGTTLVLQKRDGTSVTLIVAADAELEIDDFDTTRDESNDEPAVTLLEALTPGVVVSEVETDAAGQVVEIEVGQADDGSQDTNETCDADSPDSDD